MTPRIMGHFFSQVRETPFSLTNNKYFENVARMLLDGW
jgi:hypothetical protein